MENPEPVYESIIDLINKHVSQIENLEIEMTPEEVNRRQKAIGRLNEALDYYGKLLTAYNLRR